MPVSKTKAGAASQARTAQVARAVKQGKRKIEDIQPRGFRDAVRSMLSMSEGQLGVLVQEARDKAGPLLKGRS